MHSEQRKGELLAIIAAGLWSLFPVITVLTISALPPLFSAAISTALSAVFFAVLLTVKKGWKRIPSLATWRDLLMTTLLIGIIFYCLVFTGYQYTTAGNGAIVSMTEIFFAFVIVNLIWKHEGFVLEHMVGALLMIVGALVILIPKQSGQWNVGDLLMLLGYTVTPIGNVFAQRARKVVSAEMLMFIRSGLSAAALFIIAFAFEGLPSLDALPGSMFIILLNGVFLLGLSKILWIEAIHRIPIAKTVAITAVEVPLTLIFAYFILGQTATMEQLVGVMPMILGMFLLTRK
jgi:drug/metabolite transporter (DMT)-like permease